MQNYKDVSVWQNAMNVVVRVYQVSKDFSSDELYGLRSQMRRSAVSIVSNIAEGRRRSSDGEFGQFLYIAFGSGAERETQIEIVRRLHISSANSLIPLEENLLVIMKQLNKMISSLTDGYKPQATSH